MATTKSFTESINEVKNSNVSKAMKIKSLKALNLTDYEISLILKESTETVRGLAKSFKITFGVEIETFGMVRENLERIASENSLNIEYQGYNHRDSNTIYKFVTDGSVVDNNGNSYGTCIECVSPVLNSTKAGYKSLENCCNTLNAAGARVNKSCGLHVHIGAASLTDEQYINVFKNYKMLEGVIDSFMANSRRANNSQWCRTLSDHNFVNCNLKSDVAYKLGSRYHKVNAESYGRHKTIEFRQHQGTTDYVKISHWVRFCANLVLWSCNNVLSDRVNTIDDIPFLTKADKAYYKSRKEQLA